MAAPLSADRFLAALRAEGVRVVERAGWRTHNRNHMGPWGGVNGVAIHHTAGSNSLGVCVHGVPGLPGPLCHTHLAKNGTATLVGYGRTNHAGTFAANAHAAVVAESSTHPRPDATETIDGNQHYYGIEIENLGTGRDPYPAVQYDQAVRWAAAICRAHGWSAHSVIGHKEGTRRKIDPSFDMAEFRGDIAERLKQPASWSPGSATPKPPPEEDMPTVPEIVKGIAKTDGVFDVPARWRAGNPTNEQWQFESILAFLGDRTLDVGEAVSSLASKVAALDSVELTDAQVAALADKVAAHPTLADQIAEKVAAKIATRLAE